MVFVVVIVAPNNGLADARVIWRICAGEGMDDLRVDLVTGLLRGSSVCQPLTVVFYKEPEHTPDCQEEGCVVREVLSCACAGWRGRPDDVAGKLFSPGPLWPHHDQHTVEGEGRNRARQRRDDV